MKFISNISKRQKRFISLVAFFAFNKNAIIPIKEGDLNLKYFLISLCNNIKLEELDTVIQIILKSQGKKLSPAYQRKLARIC